MRTLLAVALSVMVAWPQADGKPSQYRVSGLVVNSITGKPLGQVLVTISPAEPGEKETAAATTAGDGRFAFDGLPAGKWSLFAERKGFVRQGYGQRPEPGSPAGAVVTGPGADAQSLVFRIDPPAIVHGKIIDETGEPVAGALLQFLVRVAGGRRRFFNLKQARTDDLGEYRVWDLPPVPCYVLAVARTASQGGLRAFEPQYFPNTPEASSARPLPLKPGEEFTADFLLKPARGVSILVQGGSGSEGMLLFGEGAQGTEVLMAVGHGNALENITPGRYKLAVIDNGRRTVSSKRIEVGTSDVTVALPLPAPTSVSAKLRIVDAKPELMGKVILLLHAEGEMQAHGRMPAPDGTVTIPDLAPGRYRLFLVGTPQLYLKSAAANGVALRNGFVDLPETGAVQLDIVGSGDGGRVSGQVRAGGKPIPSALVVLAPRADSDNSSDYTGYQTASDGSFEYLGVKPGDYVLFATTDWQLEYGNPSAIRKYLAMGRALRVEPKDSLEIQLEPLRP